VEIVLGITAASAAAAGAARSLTERGETDRTSGACRARSATSPRRASVPGSAARRC
jgi:hypothetical protein